MENQTFLEKIEKHFGVRQDKEVVELETWTNGGVNMHIVLYKDEERGDYLHQFRNYVEGFCVDEEIDAHRQNEGYRSAFTIRMSLEDFEEYLDDLQITLRSLEK